MSNIHIHTVNDKTPSVTAKIYVFHSDAGHGWIAVKRRELVELGIIDKISSCSYQKGKTVYLEEDCDAGLFIQAMNDKGTPFQYRESYVEYSPIRRYNHFSA
jgi:hypothetical protein